MNCTVCDFEINEHNPRLTEQYQGRTFAFCCPSCKAIFDAYPAKFAGAAAGVR